jgi:hypothetical protein
MYGTLEIGVYGSFGSLDLRILSVPPENKNRGLCVFASRLVLRIFLESYGTLVAVSAPLVMLLHDSDILMNVLFASCNKKPTTGRRRRRNRKSLSAAISGTSVYRGSKRGRRVVRRTRRAKSDCPTTGDRGAALTLVRLEWLNRRPGALGLRLSIVFVVVHYCSI